MKKSHCYFFATFSQMMGHPSIPAVIPSDFSSPYNVCPELFVYLYLQELFSVQLFALVLHHYLCSGQLNLAVNIIFSRYIPIPSSPSLLFWSENFFIRLVTLFLNVLAVKRNPSIAFKVVATFYHEVPRSQILGLRSKTPSPISSRTFIVSFLSVRCITLQGKKQF